MSATWLVSVEEAWREHSTELRDFVARLSGSVTETDDILQSTFETLLRIGPRDTAGYDQRTLMFGVAANTVRHHRRSVARLSALRDRLAHWSDFEVASPDHHVERAQLRRDFEWATQQLPQAQRDVIHALLEGLSAAEVARRSRETESTVRSRSMYAKRQLKTLLRYGWLFALAAAVAFGATFVWKRIVSAPVKPTQPLPLPLLRPLPTTGELPVPTPASLVAPSVRMPALPRLPPPEPTAEQPPAFTRFEPDQRSRSYDEAHRAQFVERDLPKAIAGWNRYLAFTPAGALADDARFFRAVALFKEGRLDAALGAAENALATEPRSAHFDELIELQRLLKESQ